ncbi:hypothetical protein BKA82DRAFT_1007459, partial [Pisolithus tinctorius]
MGVEAGEAPTTLPSIWREVTNCPPMRKAQQRASSWVKITARVVQARARVVPGTFRNDVYKDVEDASERYGRDGCTSPGCDGLGGAILLPFCIGKGEGLGEGEGGCDSALGELLGSKVIPADENPTGGSGSAVDGTGFGKGIFRKTFVR